MTKQSDLNGELTFEEVSAAFDAIMKEGKRQHVIVWGAMVSVQDIRNFIRVAFRAIADRRADAHPSR